MGAITQSLFYAGLEKEQMDKVLPEAREENIRNLLIYSTMMVIIFSVCLIVSFLAGGELIVNRMIYATMIIMGILLHLGTRFIVGKDPSLSTPFTVICIMSLYFYAFSVSLLHPGMQGVAAVAFLLVMPALFNYRPISMIILTVIALVVYCSLSAQVKEHSIAMLDMWNCLFFGAIAVLLSIFQMRVKFRLLYQKWMNHYLSVTDLLTDTRNRNSYEKSREKYAVTCKETVACVFADANGLHELNDTRGHEEGDRLLKTVADAMVKAFGHDDTYRIGGDEFVSFCTDTEADEIAGKIRKVSEEVRGKGYSVSIGMSIQNRAHADIHHLVHDAEHAMYKDKSVYYKISGHERRSSQRQARA